MRKYGKAARIATATALAGGAAATALAITPGTFGNFTSSQTDTGSVTSGTLSITDSVNGALSLSGTAPYTATNLAPGHSVSTTVTITNAGSLPAGVTLGVSHVTNGFAASDISISVSDGHGNTPVNGALPATSGTIAAAAVNDHQNSDGATWNPTDANTFTVTVSLASGAGNGDQNKTASFQLDWAATSL